MKSPIPIAAASDRLFPKSEIEQSIPDRFEKQVSAYPDRIAVKTRQVTLTYRDLNRCANRIARVLLDRGGGSEAPVGLVLEQGASAVAAILGVLKAGKFYVPLDPSDPAERTSIFLEDVQPELVLTDRESLPNLAGLNIENSRLILLDDVERAAPGANIGLQIAPEKPAYIFSTSGSTGRPKGVVDCHRNVLHNVMRYTNNLHITYADRLTLLQSCSFSGSVSSLFCALLNGATVYPFNLRRHNLESLASLIVDEQLTIYHSVPTIFEGLVATGKHFDSLRVVRLEGDKCSPQDVHLFRQHCSPSCCLANGLGTTETGLARQYLIDLETEVPETVVPIGYAVEDMECLVLDQAGTELASGCIGEIAVRSQYLATGYWRNPALTRDRFRADPSGTGARVYRTGDLGRMRPELLSKVVYGFVMRRRDPGVLHSRI